MNKKRLYQVYDNRAGSIAGPIMAERIDAPAIRTFFDILKNPQTLPGQHPDDFDLIIVGQQDEETGVIDAWTQPDIIVTGEQWRRAQEANNQTPNDR